MAAIEQSIALAPTELTVILHGGEPTLVFGFLRQVVEYGERVAYHEGKRVVFRGQTNLSRLNAEFVDFSLKHRIKWGISLDGPPEMNDAFRRFRDGSGTHHLFQQGLENYPEFVRRCNVMSTITSATDSHLLAIARYFRDLGMAGWDWSLFQPIGRGRGGAGFLDFSVSRVIRSWNELFDAVLDGEFDGFAIKPITKYLDNFFYGPSGNMCMRKECGAARDLLSVSADGTIEACDCIDPKGTIAGLGKARRNCSSSMRDAKESDLSRLIRSRNVELGPCQSCIWLTVCGGTCLAHAHPTQGLNGVWGAQCEIALNSFRRITESVAVSNRLSSYLGSLPNQQHVS